MVKSVQPDHGARPRRFQQSRRCGSDRYHAAASPLALHHGLRRRSRYFSPLRLNLMLRHVLDRNRLERAGPDVQSDKSLLDAGVSPVRRTGAA